MNKGESVLKELTCQCGQVIKKYIIEKVKYNPYSYRMQLNCENCGARIKYLFKEEVEAIMKMKRKKRKRRE